MITRNMQPPKDIAGYDPIATAGDCYFDSAKALHAINFFPSFLKHVKGPLARQPFELNPWEVDFVATLFGWMRPDGTRRYREAFVGIPRKNNKTFLTAGIALYCLMCDGEEGAEILCGAADQTQATEVFRPAMINCRRSPVLSTKCHVVEHTKTIRFGDASFMRAIPAEAAGQHGGSTHVGIIDEIHTQPDRELYDVVRTSMVNRRQPLMISLTTAGTDKESICFELWEYAQKIRDGIISDPYFLPCIYQATEQDDWTSPEVWARVNPNYGRSVNAEYLQEAFARAKTTPAFENTFKRLHLNIWTEAEVRWINSAVWDACGVAEYPDLEHCRAALGVDLASTMDTASVVAAVEKGNDVYLDERIFVPEEIVSTAPKKFQRQYADWISQGLMTATKGSATDYKAIEKHIDDLFAKYDVVDVGFDRWQGEYMRQMLEDKYDPDKITKMATIGAEMTIATKKFEEALIENRVWHNRSPVLRWMASCCMIKENADGSKRLDKGSSHGKKGTRGKIDGIWAAVTAYHKLNRPDDDQGNPYTGENARGIITI